MNSSFDYIVVGGGAAGCLLANRLSENPEHRVLLLEAGGHSDALRFWVPVGYRYTIGHPDSDWCFTGAPEPGLDGRSLKHPRGKALGGSTAINGMVAIRGQAADYDAWRDAGLPGWGWDDVLPYFKRHEDYFGGFSALHHVGGEWRVDAPRVTWPIQRAVQAAASEAGIPITDDFNAGDNLGVGLIHVNQKNGRRWSAADAFLKPVLKRPNLSVQTHALVDRVLMEAQREQGNVHDNVQRATGVVWQDASRPGATAISAWAAKEVVLAAGALGTPQILMRSGVGPAAHLAYLGIAPVLDRPGVGANLQDHLQIGMRYEIQGADTLNAHMHSNWAKARMVAQFGLMSSGPLTMAPCQLGIFAKSSPGLDRADLGFNVLAFSRESFQSAFDPFPGITMISYDLRPSSRGQVRLTGKHPGDVPHIQANYLTTERDQRVAANAIRLTRRIMNQPALRHHQPREKWAGTGVPDSDEAGLIAVARATGVSIFHPVGTARMGRADDALAVVDAELKVRGVQNLRVIDASIMPSLISGNTATPTLMIAEKGAAMMLTPA